MRVGVDFDRVLFDTEDFKDYLEQKIPGFLDSYGLATGEGYNPEKHSEIMDVEPDVIYDTLDYETGRFLYDDIDVLGELDEQHEVVIISRGDPEFQGTKIENADLDHEYFIVTGESEENPKQLGEKTQHPGEQPLDYLIDDREYEHESFDGPGFHMQRPRDGLEDVFTDSGELIDRQP